MLSVKNSLPACVLIIFVIIYRNSTSKSHPKMVRSSAGRRGTHPLLIVQKVTQISFRGKQGILGKHSSTLTYGIRPDDVDLFSNSPAYSHICNRSYDNINGRIHERRRDHMRHDRIGDVLVVIAHNRSYYESVP